MDETTNQIEQHIRRTRDNLSENFNELGDKVKDAVDWRTQFDQRPGVMLAVAFGVGVLASALVPSGRRGYGNRWRSNEDFGESGEVDGYSAESSEGQPVRRSFAPIQGRLNGTLRALKGAVMGLATSRLAQVIEEFVPGFQQEFRRARRDDDYSDDYSDGRGSRSSNSTAWQRASSVAAEAD